MTYVHISYIFKRFTQSKQILIPSILDEKINNRSFIDVILEPHRCYYKALSDLFDKDYITGLAHITGGGICENLNRILPNNMDANIDVSNEALGQLKEEMNKMKDEVINASGLLQNRGEKLQVLSENADALSSASNNYYKSSKKVKRAECMKKVKIYGAIAVAVIIIIILLILIFN